MIKYPIERKLPLIQAPAFNFREVKCISKEKFFPNDDDSSLPKTFNFVELREMIIWA